MHSKKQKPTQKHFNSRIGIISIFLILNLFQMEADEITEKPDIPLYDVSEPSLDLKDFEVGLIITDAAVQNPDTVLNMQASMTVSSSRLIARSPRKNYWALFRIENQSDGHVDRIIRIDEYGAERVNLHILEGEDRQSLFSGMEIPINERRIRNRNPVFILTLQPGEEQTIILEYHSKFVSPSGIHIEDPKVFYNTELLNIGGYWFYFGASLALLLYNLFLYFSLRDKSFLLYVLFVLTFLIFAVLHSGFSGYAVTRPVFHYLLTSSVSLLFFFLCRFTRELLKTGEDLVGADYILSVMSFLFLLGALLIIINIRFALFTGYIGMPASVIMLAIGIQGIQKGIPLARYYVLAMTAYLLGVLSIIALNLDLVPYNFITRYSYLLGSLLMLILFSLALGHRFKIAQEEKLLYRNKLYDSEKKIRQDLEQIVQERTSQLSEANRELERMAIVDSLTGLYNRRHFDRKLNYEWNRLQRDALPMSLIMCDIDFFKIYNDTLGHQAGDDCIRTVAGVIKECAARESDIPTRYGGEEFCIILPATSSENALEIAGKIREMLRMKSIRHPGTDKGIVTMSYGVATMIPTKPPGSQGLVEAADEALYQSKNDGRDRISVAHL